MTPDPIHPHRSRGIAKIVAALVLLAGGGLLIKSGIEDVRYEQRVENDAKLVGSIRFEVRDSSGRMKETRQLDNLVVDVGKAGVAGQINGVTTNAFEHIAIGTGTTGPVAGNTTCEAEITTNGGQRAPGTASRVTTDTTNDTAQVELTYNFTGTFAVTESCLLDSLAGGVLLSRQTFAAINVGSGDSLLVRWKIDVD